MRIPWKVVGLAGLAGVAATGAVVVRRRRAQRAYDPAELRARLHRRLAEVAPEDAGGGPHRARPSDPGGGLPEAVNHGSLLSLCRTARPSAPSAGAP